MHIALQPLSSVLERFGCQQNIGFFFIKGDIFLTTVQLCGMKQ